MERRGGRPAQLAVPSSPGVGAGSDSPRELRAALNKLALQGPNSPGGNNVFSSQATLVGLPLALNHPFQQQSSSDKFTDLDAEYGHITTPKKPRSGSQHSAAGLLTSGGRPRMPRLVLPGMPSHSPRSTSTPTATSADNPFLIAQQPPPKMLMGGPDRGTSAARPVSDREILEVEEEEEGSEAEEEEDDDDDELGPVRPAHGGRRVVSDSSMRSGATEEDGEAEERDDSGRPDDASDYYPSDPEDFSTFHNLSSTSHLAVAWSNHPVSRSHPATPFPGRTIASSYEIPQWVREGLYRIAGEKRRRIVARGWDTLCRVRRRVVEEYGKEAEIGYFLTRAYRFNREKGKWSDKGPVAVFLVAGVAGAGCALGVSLFGARNEVFCFGVWEDFPRLLRTSIVPSTKPGKPPRYLLTFHTAAQSALPNPIQTLITATLGQLHPERIRGDSDWARVEVGVVHVQGVVRAERDAEDERRGGRMWCLDAGDESQATQLHAGLMQLAQLAKQAAIDRRVETFMKPHQPTPAGLDNATGTWKLGSEAPEEARRRAHGQAEIGWPLSKDRGMLEYLARQRFVSRPLISQTGQLVADAVNCELCNCVLYDFTSKNGENIVQLHKESRESVEWGRENGVAGCWGCDD